MTTGAQNAREEVAQRLERLARRIRTSAGTEAQYDALYSAIIKLAYESQQLTVDNHSQERMHA